MQHILAHDEMAELVVVTGPPGAGKSTIAELLVSDFDPSALVAGDQFFGFLRAGSIAPWLPQAHQQNEVVILSAAAASGRLARGGVTVVYDGVLGPPAGSPAVPPPGEPSPPSTAAAGPPDRQTAP